MEAFITRLGRILPAGCGFAVGRIGGDPPCQFPEEDALVHKAVAQRRREFHAGRSLARRALVQVGGPSVAIPAHDAGDPIWPVDFVGSIAHAGGWAGAVAAPARKLTAVGLDLDCDRPLDTDLRGLVCRPDETLVEPLLLARGIDAAMLRFVAKEACFKAVYPIARRYFDFLDAKVTFDLERDSFRIEVDRRSPAPPIAGDLTGRFAQGNGLLAAVAYLSAGGPR